MRSALVASSSNFRKIRVPSDEEVATARPMPSRSQSFFMIDKTQAVTSTLLALGERREQSADHIRGFPGEQH
jgi:hypothetical protein